jgi:signal transduction histidine kinase
VEEMKSNFLRMMSHDVKTPVARIQGMTELALRDPNPLSESQIQALKTIAASTEELSSFFGSILNLGRIESKEIQLHLRSKDINALLQEVISKCEYLAQQKNIRMITEFEPMFSMKIDEDLMRQVFTNLIENAIKYSPENSSILVSTEETEGQVRVQVADQGIGIPESDIPRLFSKFHRAENAKTSDIKGSGLGLYLSNYFVNLHQGKINVESEPNKGSTFTVELPMNL